MSPKKKILLVEDDQDLALALTLRLKATGYQVLHVGDAVQATIVARRQQPDLAILDLGLPGGDGITVLQRFSRLPNDLPVIVLTARDAATYRDRVLAMGAERFFQKPVDNEEMISAIGEILEGGERGPQSV